MPVASGTGGGGGGIDFTSKLSVAELLALAAYAGFKPGQQQANVTAVALAESGGDPNATNVNTDGSRDRGLYQINDKYHPEVSDTCAYDPVCSAKAAYSISNRGTSFSPWNSPWPQFLPAVHKAQATGSWKQYQTQFRYDTGTGAQAPPAPQASRAGHMLFNCPSGGVTHTGIGPLQIPTGLNLPDVGCYLLDSMWFAMYAVGGLILFGAGILLLAHKNPVKVAASGGMKAVALTPWGRAAAGAQAARPPSPSLQLAQQREQRIAQRQAQRGPVDLRKARAEASKTAAQAAVIREEARAKAQRRKQGAMYGMTGPTKKVTILGQDVEIPSFDVEGMPDPSRMAG